jgi:hypothetical protein
MRKVSTLAGLILLALAATARAEEPVAAQRRLELGVSLLPMALGKFIASPGGMTITADAAFAAGIGVSASYVVTRGLSIGLAPQAIFNVKVKEDDGAAAKEIDVLARVAYTLPLADGIGIYVEALPGYSLIIPPAGDTAKGLVLAGGAGAAMDVTDRVFATLGVGYQVGLQKRSEGGMDVDVRTRYVRVGLGGGMRF